MAKKSFSIQTPRGTIVRVKLKNGRVQAKLTWNPGFEEETERRFQSAQELLDSEVLRYSDPYVPMQTGMLKQSGQLGTEIGSGEVRYIAPYAREQYYRGRSPGESNTGPLRGRYWFERMKADKKAALLKAVKRRMGE